jgi:hypothetical protein
LMIDGVSRESAFFSAGLTENFEILNIYLKEGCRFGGGHWETFYEFLYQYEVGTLDGYSAFSALAHRRWHSASDRV